MPKQNSVSVFDFNVPALIPGQKIQPEDGISEKLLLMYLGGYCKKWVFQGENPDDKNPHWQVRCSLIKKRFAGVAAAACRDFFRGELQNPEWTGRGLNWFNPTSGDTALADDFLYVLKLDTRVTPPKRWDESVKTKYIQKRFRGLKPLLPWQLKLKNLVADDYKSGNDRNIHFVVDDGGEGKSWFKGHMKSHSDNAIIMPSTLPSAGDMMQFLCSNPAIKEGGHYIILMDVPRATSPKHWYSLAQGLEAIKQGFLYDSRYTCKEKVIEPPVMVCFANAKPPDGVMTKDVFIYFDKNCNV